MRFFISRPDNLVAIDNVATAVDCSSLPATTKYVVWNENGSGFIEPSAGVALRTSFSDPSPYQTFINGWITAQVSAGITLSQAKAVKNDFIKAVYSAKRQRPVTVSTTAGTLQWDGSDASVAQYSTLAITSLNYGISTLSGVSTSLVDAINAALGAVVADLNAIVGALNTAISAVDQQASAGNTLVGQYNGLVSAFNVLIGNNGSTGLGAYERALDQYLQYVQNLASNPPENGNGGG